MLANNQTIDNSFTATQTKMIERANVRKDEFWFTRDIGTVKEFNSCKDIKEFKLAYDQLEQHEKHFYEIVHGHHYEFYDLDLKLDETNSEKTPMDLFIWFDQIS